MYLVRLWLFTARAGEYYPEGGTYDTSVIDVDSGNCGDAQQFDRFEVMLDYANARGEELQQVSSAEEAYAICSRQRYTPGVATCGGGMSNNQSTISAAISRPISACQGGTFAGGGSRTSPPSAPCPPVPPIVEPTLSSQPVVTTITDQARRIIALSRRNKIVPTIVY